MQRVFTTENTEGTEKNGIRNILRSRLSVANCSSGHSLRQSFRAEKTDYLMSTFEKVFSVLSVSSVVNAFFRLAIDYGACHQEPRPCF